MALPEPYFSLSDSQDMSCATRFFLEPVPQLRDSWDKHMVLPQTETMSIFHTATKHKFNTTTHSSSTEKNTGSGYSMEFIKIYSKI